MVEPRNGGLMPEIFGERQDRQAALGRGREQAVDVLQAQAAIVERALDALRHQVDDGQSVRHFAEVGFGHADDRRAAALEPVHHAPSTGTKTGYGGSSPPG